MINSVAVIGSPEIHDQQEPIGSINVYRCKCTVASKIVLMVKNPPASAADIKKCGLIPELGRSAGGWHDNHPPVFLPGESYGQRSLESYSPQGLKESDTTEVT